MRPELIFCPRWDKEYIAALIHKIVYFFPVGLIETFNNKLEKYSVSIIAVIVRMNYSCDLKNIVNSWLIDFFTLDLLAPDPFRIILSKGGSLWKLLNCGY